MMPTCGVSATLISLASRLGRVAGRLLCLTHLFGRRVRDSPMGLWRTGFYLLMCWSWSNLHHGPMSYWEEAFLYDHTAWITSFTRATTEVHATALRWGGCTLALLSIRSNWASLGFAIMFLHYLMTAITNFVNHDYLFVLLSFLLAFYNNASSKEAKRIWLHVMRAQIVVVYAFASLWKLHPDWLDGTICSHIFLGFEQQGVAYSKDAAEKIREANA